MNLLNKITLIFVIIISVNNLNAQDDKTNIFIQTNVDSAGLFIDNNFIGVGNKFNVQKVAGIYTITLVENLSNWNAEVINDTIIVENKQEIFRNVNFKDEKLINTKPEDVRVFESDSLIGFTPLLLDNEFKNLTLEKPDYVNLSVIPEEISGGQIPELKFNGEPSKKEFYGSTLFSILLGTAIALGAASANYKLEADNLYEQYKISGDPGLVDNIDQYDGQSAGTFIAMEICIGALIYFFLAD